MVYTYGETVAVDIAHADVAYRLFDAWKGLGYNPSLQVSTAGAGVSYLRTIVTVDVKEGDDESNIAN